MFDSDEAVQALWEAVSDGPPAWVVFDRDDGVPDAFTLRPGPGAMVGWRAPDTAWALGVSAPGRAWTPDDGYARRAACRVACVVDRWGKVAARLDAPALGLGDGLVLHDAPRSGHVLDVMLRCLGLPTPEDPSPVGGVLSTCWLAAIDLEACCRGRRLGWAEALACHPALVLDPPPGGLHGAVLPDRTVQLAIDRCRTWSWEDIRSRCVARGVMVGDVDPPLAAWMDAGIFGRWQRCWHEGLGDAPDVWLRALDPAVVASARSVVAACVQSTGSSPRHA